VYIPPLDTFFSKAFVGNLMAWLNIESMEKQKNRDSHTKWAKRGGKKSKTCIFSCNAREVIVPKYRKN
jgi:hypothetical protein